MVLPECVQRWVETLSERQPASFARLDRISYSFDRQRFETLRDQMPSLADACVAEPLHDSLVSKINADLESGFDLQRGDLPTPGFVVRAGKRCVSMAWGPMAGNWVELGVVTAASHRRLGLAKHAGARLIESLLAKNWIPHVSTNATNDPAKRWAESLGFVDPRNHEWLIVKRNCSSQP